MDVSRAKISWLGSMCLLTFVVTAACQPAITPRNSGAALHYSVFAASPVSGALAMVDIPEGNVGWIDIGMNGYIEETETIDDCLYVSVLDPTIMNSPVNGIYQIENADGVISASRLLADSPETGSVVGITAGGRSLLVLTTTNILEKQVGSGDFKVLGRATPHSQVHSFEWSDGVLYYVSENGVLGAFDTSSQHTSLRKSMSTSQDDIFPFGIGGVVGNNLLLAKAGEVQDLVNCQDGRRDSSLFELLRRKRAARVKEIQGAVFAWRVIQHPTLHSEVFVLDTDVACTVSDIWITDVAEVTRSAGAWPRTRRPD